MVRILIFVVNTALLFSCATTHFSIIDVPEDISHIQLCTNYHELASDEFRYEIDSAIQEFIDMHNASSSTYKMQGCTNFDALQTLNFYFEPPFYVRGKQNVAATFGNVMGLVALPVGLAVAGSEFIFGFYFWPDTKTKVYVSISEDLIGDAGPQYSMVLTSSGYFNSVEKQNFKQGTKFYSTLYSWFKHIEIQRAMYQQTASQSLLNQ